MPNGEEQQAENSKERSGSGAKKKASAMPAKARGEEIPRLRSAVGDARQAVQVMLEDWREMVEDRPFRALGLAIGAGYVVGGGLLTPLTGRLLLGAVRMGFRLAAIPLVRDELMGVLESATERVRGETERRHQ
jgi:ElaB/YqjD/DUF883 family membrane-anchored ribosome-binding protein